MQIRPLPYDEEALSRYEREGPFVWLWEPQGLACVLGAGTPEADVDLALCDATGVPVYRRRGGGGAVILTPGSLIITACYDRSRKPFATHWIQPVAEGIMRALQAVGVEGARVLGMGDVAIGDRKILGSSLYVNRRVALYQGSLLTDADLDLVARYLPHPSREPEYRRGRPHLEFLTSVVRSGFTVNLPALRAALVRELARV